MSVTPFAPANFTTPVIAPAATTLTRRIPYIGPSEFKAAPTALSLDNLVPGGTVGENAAELYNVLLRASDWVDLICFHGPDGTLAASPTVQAGWVTPKAWGFKLPCNFKPILSVTGLALGCGPQGLADIDQTTAQAISIETSTIRVPQPQMPRIGRTYACWSYIAGFPHMVLADDAVEGADTITVTASVPGDEAYGVYPGTQLTVRDPEGGVEVIVIQSIAGPVLTLTSPLQFSHAVPDYPDFIYVTALPHGVAQATISLASCLIKLRGTRAMTMPTAPGGQPTKSALSQAGGIEDYEIAVDFLKPFTTVYRAT